jgi:formylglycine-generating enzyme
VMGSNPSYFGNGGEECLVEGVSWDDCQSFIKKLNQMEGKDLYNFPTEAQWEYACRAGMRTPFFFGNCLSTDEANYDGNYPYSGCSKGKCRTETTPVYSFWANAWGLYDMHGNVWEWCRDWYGDYPKGSVTDPVGPSSGDFRVIRGGSWDDYARYCRSAYRDYFSPDDRDGYLGFRLLRS